MNSGPQLTDLIHQAQSGDAVAMKSVFDAMYEDLRRMARQRLRPGQRGTMLDTTALVHESFLRFANNGRLQLSDRLHFLKYASQVMRSVIVDYVRERMAEKHGGGFAQVTLTTQVADSAAAGGDEILRVHDALEDLARLDVRLAQVVEMRYFGGMTEVEIAEALGVTDRTVRRDWEKARVLLAASLQQT